jgi:hypothetical protein
MNTKLLSFSRCAAVASLFSALICASNAFAETNTVIEGMKVEPMQAKVGDTVKITVTGTEGDIPNCGLKLHFGDGMTRDFKLTKAGMLPLVVEYKYEKAGDFKVMAEPKMVTSHLKCIGKNQNVMVKVAALPAPVAAPVPAPAPAPVAAAPAAAPATKAAGPSCPEGWKLDAKSVVKKTGAFKCTAASGTKLPEKKLTCPGDLSYVENSKKGMIACQL